MSEKKKIWFFRYDTWQDVVVYLPMTWYQFKRYYEMNGKYPEHWDWIPPLMSYDETTIDQIVEEAVSHRADIYMFSSYVWSWDTIKIIAHAVKEELPESLVILGGPHQGITYTQPMIWFNDHPYFDATARPAEYGEYFITDMLDQLSEGQLDWSTIRGSYSRKGYGPEGIKTDFHYPSGLLSTNIDHARQVLEFAQNQDKKLGLMYETNRGCMYKCSYCEWGGGTNTKLRMKDMKDIEDDMSFFREINIHTLFINDANFGILKRDPEISKLLSSHNDHIKLIGLTGLAKTISAKRKAVLEPLIESGLVSIYQVSLQSIDPIILENIERTDVTPEENIALAKYFIEKYDIDVVVELILGLPGMKLETFYNEVEVEYILMNSIKPQTHHVPLYLLPDAPISNPAYIEKFQIKYAPIGFEESLELINNSDSKFVQSFKQKKYREEAAMYIPISSYSYSIEDWKEMFFMNDMNQVLMNMAMITPLVDFLYRHRQYSISKTFKKIFLSMKNTKGFYDLVHDEYLTKIINGEYAKKPWRQFEVGPIKGAWSLHDSYLWLWCHYKKQVYNNLRQELSDIMDEMIEDCLTYCENSTVSDTDETIWINKWRWDIWEENRDYDNLPLNENITLITKKEHVEYNQKKTYRNQNTYRLETDEKIKIKLFSGVRPR